jgi:bifunctional UDP-N-acetylglucosamine pyrophosphorylase/glucosamine-1-phosphate N-acetyltransferase
MRVSQKISASPAILILAAGLGKRMKSPLPKVLHDVCGEPMLLALLRSVRAAAEAMPGGLENLAIGIVVGHGRDLVETAVRTSEATRGMRVEFLLQNEQKGTGHAVRCAMDTEWGKERVRSGSPILVLPGDSPLIPANLISDMLAPFAASEKGAALRLLTCEVPDPKGYGRIVRSGKGANAKVQRIVEEKDASAKERAIREVAASIYTFDAKYLADALPKLSTKNAQGEYYLTDLVAHAAKKKRKVPTLSWPNAEDVRGVNDLWELSLAEKTLQLRIIERHARNGVRFLDPGSVACEASVTLGDGVRIHRGVVLRGKTTIGDRVEIGSNTVLRNTRVGDGAELKAGCYCQDCEIGAGAKVGPYAHLRPESVVGREAKIGNFVELKKAVIGEHTSIAHLSYVGDAKVGARVNIGCGFVTCNYDGRVKNGSRKHETIIEDDCFIGSDCQTIAPIRIGRGAYVASGSTVTQSVEPDALAIARSRQVNKAGYAKRLRPKKD